MMYCNIPPQRAFGQAPSTISAFQFLYKPTKGNPPETGQMIARVREMIEDAPQGYDLEELFQNWETGSINRPRRFRQDYLAMIDRFKLSNTKIKLLQRLLAKVTRA